LINNISMCISRNIRGCLRTVCTNVSMKTHKFIQQPLYFCSHAGPRSEIVHLNCFTIHVNLNSGYTSTAFEFFLDVSKLFDESIK
jgi:hypothetical protein